MNTLWKIIGVGAAFGIGYLIFKPKKSSAASGGCFDRNGVMAWAKGESAVKSVLLIRSKLDLAVAPVTGEISHIVVGDTCSVHALNTTDHKFKYDQAMTDSLRSFLNSLVPVKGETVAGVITWEAA